MHWAKFKDPVSHMCLAGTVVACWSLTKKVAGWQVQVLLYIFVIEFPEFRENIQEKLQCHSTLLLLTEIYCLFIFCPGVPVSTSFIATTIFDYEEEYCIRYYPETIPCPPLPEDMFGFLHNYTNPRPITVEETEQVILSCFNRLLFLGCHEFNHSSFS